MKAKQKQGTAYRGVCLPEDIDNRLREIAAGERRSVTQTVIILLEDALKQRDSVAEDGRAAEKPAGKPAA